MKRVFCLILSLVLMASIIFVPTAANAGAYGDLSYEKYDDHIEITDCDESAIYFDHVKPITVINRTVDTITVCVSLDNLSGEAQAISKVYIALYDDNGAVIDCFSEDYSGADLTAVLKNDEKADHIKVFVWNKDGSLAPVTEASEPIAVPSAAPAPDPELLSGVAFIVGIEKENDVLKVSYYQDGELKEAVTDDIIVGDLNQNTQAGSLFKFGMTGDTITSVVPYLTFDGEIRELISKNGDDINIVGVPHISKIYTPEPISGEEVYFGAVLGKNSHYLTIAPLDAGGNIPDLTNIIAVPLSREQINYYTYNPEKGVNERCSLGAFGDILADRILTGSEGMVTDTIITYGTSKGISPAWGMLDYVFVRLYESREDVVNYTSYIYDYKVERY